MTTTISKFLNSSVFLASYNKLDLSNSSFEGRIPNQLECAFKITASAIGSDNHRIGCLATERQALLKPKSSLQLESWGKEGHEDDCCKWRGVECSVTTGHVTGIDLSHSSYYTCTIDASLVVLQHLTYLNLSMNNHGGCQIPEFIGNLSKLQELDLSFSDFGGKIPHQLGNLSLLKFLDLSYNNFCENSIPKSFKFLRNLVHINLQNSHIRGPIQEQLRNLSKLQFLGLSGNGVYSHQLKWVSQLYSLEYLLLDSVNLSEAADCAQSNLPYLTELHMGWAGVYPVVDAAPLTMTSENASSSLSIVDLSSNKLNSSIFTWLQNFNSSLSQIDLGFNSLRGPIPCDLGNMPLLSILDLSNNELEGDIPSSFGCPTGKNHTSLRYLDLRNNRLNGNLANSITQLHMLSYLDLSSNSFHGIISEDLSSNFTSMKHLFLSSNSLNLSLSPYWKPPFQLYSIELRSCKLGPQFPSWLQTQTSFYFLDISSNLISGLTPDWFWTLSSKVSYLNISENMLHGKLPTQPFSQSPLLHVDLSFNQFEGPLPLFNPHTIYIDFSNNRFTGTLSSLCKLRTLSVLDLSNNHLSGELPQCWREKSYGNLTLLNLSNNNLTGNIHNSICSSSFSSLGVLQLGNNDFSGELPSSLSNCTGLVVLDVASNMISGSIPKWIGNNVGNLRILILRSNRFSGSIPPNLCSLQSLQVMDLSKNNLTGPVIDCLYNSTFLTRNACYYLPLLLRARIVSIDLVKITNAEAFIPWQSHPSIFQESLTWKGIEYEYGENLGNMMIVDLSSNKLQGEIPEVYGSLLALRQLNLSNNNLSGSIPKRIGEMRELEVLDLSSNHLSGEIPQSISNLSFLATLNLSYNSLTGQIPAGTQIQSQSAASFMGNPGLCGEPLPKKCHRQEVDVGVKAQPPINMGGHKDEDGFYISTGIGFFIGLWGVFGSLLFHKSWRYAYFRFLNRAADWVYVRVALIVAKIL